MSEIRGTLDDGGIAPLNDPMAQFAAWMAAAAESGRRTGLCLLHQHGKRKGQGARRACERRTLLPLEIDPPPGARARVCFACER
jgi:hypothetical protein